MPLAPLGAHRDWGQAMLKFWRAFARNNRGATAVEYGLIISLIFVAILVAVNNAASSTIRMWNNVATRVVNT
jgi:pilus assembly protein Flp/PilA